MLIRLAALLLVLGAGSALLATADAEAKKAKKQRIVSLTPFANEMLVKLGVKPYAIGRPPTGNVPAKLRRVKQLTMTHPYGTNLEQLAKIKPTMVLTSNQWKKSFSVMKRMKIPFKVIDPTSIPAAYKAAKVAGKAVGKKAQGAKIAKKMKSEVKSVPRANSNLSVMGILGIGRSPQYFLGNSWGGQIIEQAAGYGSLKTGNASNPGGFSAISQEVVVTEDPDVIVGVPHGTASDISVAFEYIKTNPAWQSVAAVQNDRVKGSFDNRLLQATPDIKKTILAIRKCIQNDAVSTCK